MNRLTTWIIGSLVASTQALVPSAPIQWIGRVVGMKGSAGPFRSTAAPQQLLIKDPPNKMSRDNVPYFMLNSDSTIALEGTDGCIEAATPKSGDAIRVNRCTGKPTQKWNWIPDNHGGNHIQLKGTDKCLQASGGGGFNEAPIVLGECESKGAAAWKFEEPAVPLKQNKLNLYMVMSLMALAGVAALSLGALLRQYTGPRKLLPSSEQSRPNVASAASETSVRAVVPRMALSFGRGKDDEEQERDPNGFYVRGDDEDESRKRLPAFLTNGIAVPTWMQLIKNSISFLCIGLLPTVALSWAPTSVSLGLVVSTYLLCNRGEKSGEKKSPNAGVMLRAAGVSLLCGAIGATISLASASLFSSLPQELVMSLFVSFGFFCSGTFLKVETV